MPHSPIRSPENPPGTLIIARPKTCITGRYVHCAALLALPRMLRILGREDVDSASGPACTVLRWCGRRVGGLGPGLTSESADALPGCPSIDSSAGSQVSGTHRRAGLICPSCARGRGSQVRRPAGACHPFNQRKGMALTIVEDARVITGGVDTHADMHVAAALDPVGGLLGVQEFPVTPAGYARLLGWLGRVRDRRPGRDRRDRQLRRGPGSSCHRGRHLGRGGGPF